ncbi:alpha/beta hydrolase [Kribbella sp. NPDC026611]|uniref:alpha/beta hydrolase n=1 Tax=Kribbella sp. NPDC026611 TaxID=3154911 RepID=UPI0034119396
MFLHGGPGLSDYGHLVVGEFGGFRLTSYTQRGPLPSLSAGPFDIETHVEDARAVVSVVGDGGPVVLVGHSWGGHLAMHVCAKYPEQVSGLVLIEPFGAVGDGGEAGISAEMTRRLPRRTAVRANLLDEAALRGGATEAEALESMRLFWPTYAARYREDLQMPAGLALSVPSYRHSMDSMRHHLRLHTLERQLPGITSPVVVLHGAGSPLPIESTRATCSLLRTVELIEIERAGHFPWLESPGCVADALRRVVASWAGAEDA